jgi:hypothetical protein
MRTKLLMLSPIALLLLGCTEIVPTTGPHAPTNPSQVKFYQNEPAKFERLGTVTLMIAPEYRWDANGQAKPALDHLRADAAALGANGLLFKDYSNSELGMAGAGYDGAFYLVPVRKEPKMAVAEAIWVIKE